MSDTPARKSAKDRIRVAVENAKPAQVVQMPDRGRRGGPGGGDGGPGGADEPFELIDPKKPLDIARRIAAREFEQSGIHTLRFWRGDFYIHKDGAYQQMDEQQLCNRVTLFLDRCRRALDEGRTEPCKVNSRLVTEVTFFLKTVVSLPKTTETPSWLSEGRRQGKECPPPRDIIPVANGLVHAPTGKLMAPTAAFFATSASPVEYDEEADEPEEWLRFLAELWPDDKESIEALQRWFGYLLTGDTSRQKILLIVGPPRSGKGTIAHVLHALLGEENVCGPTLGDLGDPFGQAPLIGRTLATVSDARLGRRSDRAAIVEKLLTVSGEDTVTINRKHQAAWSGRLQTRFMLLTNELPELGDASGAFASRLVVLQLTTSFLGREDLGLRDRLKQEMPGILRWAIAGWQKLKESGKFVQPESARDALNALSDTSSNIQAFVRDYCKEDPNGFVGVDDIYSAYQGWRKNEGVDGPLSKNRFGVQLRAVCPKLKVSQPRAKKGVRRRVYIGITLTDDGWRELLTMPPPGEGPSVGASSDDY